MAAHPERPVRRLRGWGNSSEELWGQDVPKGWGRVSDKPAVPEVVQTAAVTGKVTAVTGEASSSRGGDGGGGGEEVRAQEARHNTLEGQQDRGSPIPVKPPAGEEEGDLRDAARGDISRIVEGAVDRQLSKHDEALRVLFQDIMHQQQAKFEASLADYWGRLGHEAQVNKLMREVVMNNSSVLRQLEDSKLEVLAAFAGAKQEMDAAVAERTATIIEQLKQAEEQMKEARRASEAGRSEIRQYMTQSEPPRSEGSPLETIQTEDLPGNTSGLLDEIRRIESRSASTPMWSRELKWLCPSLYDRWTQARRASRWAKRSYSSKIDEFRYREHGNSILEYIVDSRTFEWLMLLVIFLHIVYLVYQTDYRARTLRPPDAAENVAIEVCFLVVYSTELLLKMWTQRLHFVFGADRWGNLFDIVLIGGGVAELAVIQLGLGISYTKSIRIFKLQQFARLHRLLRISETMQVILRCLFTCWKSLFGSAVIILLYFLFFSTFFVAVVTDHIILGNAGDRLWFFQEHFGSVSRCMFTLYASVSSGKDWFHFYEPLMEITSTTVQTSQVFVLFSFIYVVVMVNIASAIFVQKVLVYTLDDSQNKKHSMTRVDHMDTAWMLEFCARRCGEGDSVSYRDFLRLMLRPEFRELFDQRRLRLDDAELLFKAFAKKPPGEGNTKNWQLFHADRKLFFEACMRLKREVTPAELSRSKAALHDSEQGHFEHVMSTLSNIGLQLETLSKDVGRLRRTTALGV